MKDLDIVQENLQLYAQYLWRSNDLGPTSLYLITLAMITKNR